MLSSPDIEFIHHSDKKIKEKKPQMITRGSQLCTTACDQRNCNVRQH